MFRSLSEIFIRRSWYSVLPRFDTTIDSCQESGHTCRS